MQPKNWVKCCDWYVGHMSKATPLESWWQIRITLIYMLPIRHVLAIVSTVIPNQFDYVHGRHCEYTTKKEKFCYLSRKHRCAWLMQRDHIWGGAQDSAFEKQRQRENPRWKHRITADLIKRRYMKASC